ncbi:Uncharacterised protein [Mycobacteroides abscessus subsp. abscessus]|nr:Uncharacterised protein [Mycobacteroides abscessus subsp. abscessus]
MAFTTSTVLVGVVAAEAGAASSPLNAAATLARIATGSTILTSAPLMLSYRTTGNVWKFTLPSAICPRRWNCFSVQPFESTTSLWTTFISPFSLVMSVRVPALRSCCITEIRNAC